MVRREPDFSVADRPHDRQGLLIVEADIRILVQAEDSCCADVVRRALQIGDETAWKEVFSVSLAGGVLVNEDVGKRSRRVADIAALLETVEEPSDATIDGSRIDFRIELSEVVEGVLGVDRCVVTLIVDDK